VSETILRMSLAHSSTLGVAARAIADTAQALGLAPVERTQLEALMSEVFTTVIADSFDDATHIDVDVVVTHEPGRIDISLQQHGAPSTYVSGQLPERLETLLRLGYADSVQFVSDGVRGSELKVSQLISTHALIDDADFVASTEADEHAIDLDSVVIRDLTFDDAIEVARLYFRTYGYTKIGSSWIYEPDVFRHKLESGQHLGTIAVTPTGRVVGHTGLLRSSAASHTANGGPMAVDPAFRQRGLAERMNAAFFLRVPSLKLRGLYAEVVTAHPASQKAALQLGGHEVGLVLGRQPADLNFIGFDGPSGFRRAVMVFFIPMTKPITEPAYSPPLYREICTRIYSKFNAQRTIISEPTAAPSDLPDTSQFATELVSETHYAQINVVSYGADFYEALQGLLLRFERQQFEVITLHLPVADPLTSHFGSGLDELGLSFNAIFPGLENGDVIAFGMTVVDQDPETIAVASEWGAELRQYVVSDRDRVISVKQSRARSRASMAHILDSL
jgi:RimJ/RimL family protein N-acetyltransferase